MAAIVKRNESYSVVFNYVDETGKTKQKWETFRNYKDARKRKAEIEVQLIDESFIPPSTQTVAEFLRDFITLYGEKRWGVSSYDANVGLINNYINPILGTTPIQLINVRGVDQFVRKLQSTYSVASLNKGHTPKLLSESNIEKIAQLMRTAFKQAVRWDLIPKNPFDNAVLPKVHYKPRDIWTADMIRTALETCTESKLYIAMNLSFACSLRLGEILGLTWSNVHMTDADIMADNAFVYIDKELTRATLNAIEALGKKEIFHIFEPMKRDASTRLILKTTKTKSSVRKVWLPKTVAYILREWKKSQDELRKFYVHEYEEHDLVISLPKGTPCDGRLIEESFQNLRTKAGLPRVVFHSLRHSSTTYKLKLNHGDLKATQGDTGHAEIDMITKVYAHILDEDRKINAQKFETAFYSNPDLRAVKPPESPESVLELDHLIEQLRRSPGLKKTVSQLVAASEFN